MKNIRYTSVKGLLKKPSFITKRRVFFVGMVCLILLAITPVVTYARYAQDIENRQQLMNRNSTGIILRDRNGAVFYEFGKLNDNPATLPEISDNLEKAVIASEDEDFYQHDGYSIKGIAAAMYANVLNKDPTRYGGSTITQQLVKNKLLSADKNFLRKYQEISMAVAVDRKYEKKDILEMYLSSVYFGEGAFGVKDAARIYFNKDPKDLSVAESSMLVGILPAPSKYSPLSGDKAEAKKQQERVLSRMVATGEITQKEMDDAFKQELAYNQATLTRKEEAHHFAMMVLQELQKKYGEETIIRNGYDVTTTLDLNWQKEAEKNVRERVAENASKGARNAGVVGLDPTNGQLRVLVGSVDWNNPTFGKVNMATSLRQPGSSFKPIFYTEAIEKRLITASTIIKDEPKTYGGTYRPTNYDFKYRGDITVRNALGQSLNIPAVEVMQKLGTQEAAQTAQRMGISSVTEPDKYGLSLALGTAEVKLLELSHAYTAFANKGEQYPLSNVTSIKDKFNKTIYKQEKQVTKKVASPEASYVISHILSDNNARAPTFGASLNLANNRKAAVKTGTTNDSKDAWTVGYTPQIVIGVWMGNNENEPMQSLAGSSSAGRIWKDTMNAILAGQPNQDFARPASVVSLNVCSATGLRATSGGQGTYEEVFIKGTEPTQNCNQPKPQEEKKPEKPREEEEKPEEEKPKPQEQPKPEKPPEEGGRGGGEPTPTPEPAPEPEPSPEPTTQPAT